MNGTVLYHIKRVIFSDGDMLEDIVASIMHGFLVVEPRDESEKRTWYNMQNIDVLYEVEFYNLV